MQTACHLQVRAGPSLVDLSRDSVLPQIPLGPRPCSSAPSLSSQALGGVGNLGGGRACCSPRGPSHLPGKGRHSASSGHLVNHPRRLPYRHLEGPVLSQAWKMGAGRGPPLTGVAGHPAVPRPAAPTPWPPSLSGSAPLPTLCITGRPTGPQGCSLQKFPAATEPPSFGPPDPASLSWEPAAPPGPYQRVWERKAGGAGPGRRTHGPFRFYTNSAKSC